MYIKFILYCIVLGYLKSGLVESKCLCQKRYFSLDQSGGTTHLQTDIAIPRVMLLVWLKTGRRSEYSFLLIPWSGEEEKWLNTHTHTLSESSLKAIKYLFIFQLPNYWFWKSKMTVFIKLHFLPISAWLQGHSLLDIVGILFQVGMISSPETPDKYGPWLTNLVAFHLTLIFPCKSSFTQQLLPLFWLYSVYAFFHELKCLPCEDVAIHNLKQQYEETSFECGFVCSTQTQEVLWDTVSRLGLELWAELKCIWRPQVIGLWTSPALENSPRLLRLHVGRELHPGSVPLLLFMMCWGAWGPASFCAYGICVGRFLGEGDCTDLINYHRKNSKHH